MDCPSTFSQERCRSQKAIHEGVTVYLECRVACIVNMGDRAGLPDLGWSHAG